MRIAIYLCRYLGDSVLASPFLEKLASLYPKAEIDVIGESPVVHIYKHHPRIANTYTIIDRKCALGIWERFLSLRKKRYQRIYLLRRSFLSAILSFLAGIPHRIGHDTNCRGMFLSESYPYDTDRMNDLHESRAYLELLNNRQSKEDLKENHDSIELCFPADFGWLTKEETSYARERLAHISGEKPTIIIQAGTTNLLKFWPIEQWAQLVNNLQLLYGKIDFVWSGVPAERHLYQDLEYLTNARPAYDMTASSHSIRDSMAIYNYLSQLSNTCLIGIDSGPVHLADAIGIQTISLWGPSGVSRWHPLSSKAKLVFLQTPLTCQPCYMNAPCGLGTNFRDSPPCMKNISIESVIDNITSLVRFDIPATLG